MISTWWLALAIVHATVYTGDGRSIEDGTILVEGSRITALATDVALPPEARVIDARGAPVTPGLVDAISRVGVVGVALETSSVEASLPDAADAVRAALRASDTFDGESLTIPVARAGGLTSIVVVPAGGLVSGLSAWADLTPRDALRRDPAALHVRVAGGQRGSRAQAFLRLRELLTDARLLRGNRGPFISRRLRELSASAADMEVMAATLDRKRLVVFHVNRHADIETVLRIARAEKLKIALAGAAEAWRLAARLAAAEVPVILDPLANLPTGFDSLQARDDNAQRLHAAGVRVAFSSLGDAHRAHRLRIAAGNAVARGFPRDAALAAITRVPAEIFGVEDAGVIREGALANLVVWNGDPFEPLSWATHVLLRGREVVLDTRQDALLERYRP